MITFGTTPDTDQDLDLAARVRRGESAAFDILLDRYKDMVYSLVVRTVGSQAADDVAQEVFIQFYRSLGRFRGESSLRTWIYRITINVSQQHIRGNSRQPLVTSTADVEEVLDATEPFPEVSARLMQSEIDRAIDSLPVMERTAVELHYIQGLSYQEMSEVLECPTGTIKARVHNAISRLRQKLSHLMEVDER